MIVKNEPIITQNSSGEYTITFTLPENEKDNLEALSNKMKPGREYELSIKRKTKKRSNEANAYCWELIGKIAEDLGLKPQEVYKLEILDTYCYKDELVNISELSEKMEKWQNRGIGWIAEIISLGKDPNTVWLRKFKGSSAFTSREMSHLIDNLVNEAHDLGIETLVPDEISKIKKEYKQI